jgi:cyclopropane fatty-acyl-phospholipid synthase-like methyltransferase
VMQVSNNNTMKGIKEKRNINTQEYWDRTWNQRRELEARKADKYLPNFLEYCEKSKSILDFSCGLGANVYGISRLTRSKRFILVDISSYSLNFAKENLQSEKEEHGHTYEFHQDINEVEDNGVDMIISIEVLEHITEHKETLDTLWSKLTDGGILMVSVPVKGIRDRNRQHVNKFTVNSFFQILTGYAGIVSIAPRTYSKRSGILSTEYFLLEKRPVAVPVLNPKAKNS